MKVAIAGFGVEGRASFNYWSKLGAEITIADERDSLADLPPNVKTMLGKDAFRRLSGFDLIVRSPSIPPSKLPQSENIWSATNEFFSNCPAPIIGVTGTKGKGTTSSLIASILEAAGRRVHLVGNIGQPSLGVLPEIGPDDVVIYELSSFQLWDIEKSPYVAVVLMIEPDHLDVHTDFEDYIQAKQGITKHQQAYDTIIYHADDKWSAAIAAMSKAQNRLTYPFDLGELANNLQLPGKHNLDNATAAVAAARQFTDDDKAIARGLAAFKGLPHRLKLVRELDGVKYYDDSIATTPGSAIAAIKAFDARKVIILGGSDKGVDYTELIELCQETDTTVLAIGQTGHLIAKICQANQVVCYYVGELESAVTEAHRLTEAGDVVILSPASASFDQFKNYAERGDKFIEAVTRLAQ